VGAAGRDPARFAVPDRYDLLRPAPGQLAFGAGRHRCLGVQLARLTADCALHALLEALPHLRWAPGGRPASTGLITRGPKTLPVLLSCRARVRGVPPDAGRTVSPRARGR
jgi:pulcherriminic acid synthase